MPALVLIVANPGDLQNGLLAREYLWRDPFIHRCLISVQF